MENRTKTLRIFLLLQGYCLVLVGCVLLLWFGQMVYLIVTEPEEVRIIQYIIENVSADGPVIYGAFSESIFDVNVSGSVKAFAFFILGIFALGILTGIVRSLLSGGVEIIKVALASQSLPESKEMSQSEKRVLPSRKR